MTRQASARVRRNLCPWARAGIGGYGSGNVDGAARHYRAMMGPGLGGRMAPLENGAGHFVFVVGAHLGHRRGRIRGFRIGTEETHRAPKAL